MERPAASSPSSSASTPPLKHLSPLEWETFIDDHQYGGHRRDRWTYTGSSLLDLFLSSILRKDIPLNLKLNITIFLEEFFPADFSQSETAQALTRLLEVLRSLIQSPNDGISITFSIKDQLLLSTTSIFITCGAINVDGTPNSDYTSQLEGLIELLLTVINRPNHGVDRQTRGVACECLRELERECPSLLSEVAGHLWGLCQSERTHVAQSYVLLLATVIHGIVSMKSNVSIFNTSIPLVPFNPPQFLNGSGKEISSSSYKELRRAMSFLLEWPHNLTSFGLIEFMSVIMPVAVALELQPSLLKVQFSGLLYTYDVVLCHAYLRMHLQFLDSFDGQESEIASRLVLIARETQHHLVFRLLALHWLLSFMGLMSNGEIVMEKIEKMNLWFYPTVFDPLALKSLKLDLLAYRPILLDKCTLADANGVAGQAVDSRVSVVKLFEDGLVSVSGFKWLPSWSTETAVAFRTFHKFLIGASYHSDSDSDSSSTSILMDSTIFHTIKRMLVDMTLEFQGLVPVIVAFISRLLGCSKHCCLGERLLQTFDEYLLPKVQIDYRLGSYFPIFEKIAENDTVPPGVLLEILTKFMMILVKKHGPDTGLKSWSHGSKVLSLCRTMLLHHHSSRLFLELSRLLAFTCIFYPDLEVRDSARIYLRMLICVPGKKVRLLLNVGDQVNGISPSSHSSSYFNLQSPRVSHDRKKSRNISSYIHLERLVPLLVKQSWSLSFPTLSIHDNQPGYLESIKDSDSPSGQREVDSDNNHQVISEVEGINLPDQEPLRVMDSKISEIVGTLRMHFSSIPDFRHVSGLKIKLYCSLRFESGPFSKVWAVGSHSNVSNGVDVDVPPALYATVLTFSSSAPYGAIPSYHIPFLLGEPSGSHSSSHGGQTDSSLAIVSLENGSGEEEEDSFKAHVLVELEPREPIPGLVNVSIETNTENGEIIHGNLESISVGIEDMFLKAIVPDEIQGDDAVAGYYVDLFNALWEACGSCSSTGRETFPLKGGKGVAAINGTRSVKLLEVAATCLVEAVERNLSAFVVSVIGDPLINMVRDGGIIRDVIWTSTFSDSTLDDNSGTKFSEGGPLYIKYGEEEEEDRGGSSNVLLMSKKKMGSFLILIFLPPRFHLLFEMEVSENSTLVRMRTDHWPCLAYIDDFLEALFFA